MTMPIVEPAYRTVENALIVRNGAAIGEEENKDRDCCGNRAYFRAGDGPARWVRLLWLRIETGSRGRFFRRDVTFGSRADAARNRCGDGRLCRSVACPPSWGIGPLWRCVGRPDRCGAPRRGLRFRGSLSYGFGRPGLLRNARCGVLAAAARGVLRGSEAGGLLVEDSFSIRTPAAEETALLSSSDSFRNSPVVIRRTDSLPIRAEMFPRLSTAANRCAASGLSSASLRCRGRLQLMLCE